MIHGFEWLKKKLADNEIKIMQKEREEKAIDIKNEKYFKQIFEVYEKNRKKIPKYYLVLKARELYDKLRKKNEEFKPFKGEYFCRIVEDYRPPIFQVEIKLIVDRNLNLKVNERAYEL